MNNEQEQTPPSPPQTPQTPPSPPVDPIEDPPVPEETTSDTETENTNPETNSDTSSNNSECCNDYECPPQPEPEKCDSYYVPIGVQLCPVVKLYVNKPKVCQVSKADCIPCFLEEK
jgi:hypothetical protein